MIQAWNAFIDNIERIGFYPWLSKLDADRIKFETRTLVGGRYRIHRLSRDTKKFVCLSWGDPCPCCAPGAQHAPQEAYNPDNRHWNYYISSEMRKAVANLQRLYERASRSFPVGPCPQQEGCALYYCSTRPGTSIFRRAKGSQVSAEGGYPRHRTR